MAASSGSSQNQVEKYSSGSEDADQPKNEQVVDLRKRKRMISNRESARRSRQRKQQHLDNLMAQLNHLKTQNGQILVSTNTTTQLYLNVESENSILRAQLNELTNRLHSLNEIVRCLTNPAFTATSVGALELDDQGSFDPFDLEIDDRFVMNPWGLSFRNCPIMPHMDAFMC